MSLQRKDNFFLFTLIDFLLQIIFVAMVCFGIYFLNQKPDQSITAATMEKWKQVGIAKVIEFIDAATKLVPLDQLNDLTTLLRQFKSFQELKKALEIIKKLDPGSAEIILEIPADKLKLGLENLRGKPDCFKNSAGTYISVFRIAVDDSTYTIYFNNEANKEVLEVLGKTKYTLNNGKVLSISELKDFGNKVLLNYGDCRMAVSLDVNVNRHDMPSMVSRYFFTPSRDTRILYKN
jgi:hypothetical protein